MKSSRSGPPRLGEAGPKYKKSKEFPPEPIYEYTAVVNGLRLQLCPVCKSPMGDMPGTRDAVCTSCGYKDPCCE